jgi:toxin ParE1/3/4
MRFKLRVLPAADRDIDESAAFIARDNLEAALRFYDRVDDTLRRLRQHPLRHAPYGFSHPDLMTVRKCTVIGFAKHLVFYRVTGDLIEVIRVLHGARDIRNVLGDAD